MWYNSAMPQPARRLRGAGTEGAPVGILDLFTRREARKHKKQDETIIDVDVPSRTAVVSRRKMGILESVGYLHKSPGPHNADLRGNWFWTRLWRWLADGTVYLLLFISATGLYLWFAIKAERRIGFALLGAGAVSFFGLLYGLTF